MAEKEPKPDPQVQEAYLRSIKEAGRKPLPDPNRADGK
jgi:hypothetical protein